MSISSANMTTITQNFQSLSVQDPGSAPNTGSAPNAGQAQNTGPAPNTGQAQNTAQGEPSVKQVQQALDQINSFVQSSNKDVQFSLDHSSGKILVQVMDTQNNQVIRQIPSKEALAISQALDRLQGLLIRQKA